MNNWEIGIAVLERYWRKGFGYSGARPLMQEVFREQGRREFIAKIVPDNVASVRLFQKLGATPRGVARSIFMPDARDEGDSFENHVTPRCENALGAQEPSLRGCADVIGAIGSVNMSELEKYKEAVQAIKRAILQAQYRAARAGNVEQLSLYYAVGGYVSANTRQGRWGTGAIEAISEQLQKELLGLRGFSATNLKNMRLFFEAWEPCFGSDDVSSVAADETAEKSDAIATRQLQLTNLSEVTMGGFVRKEHENPSVGIVLCKGMNKAFVDFVVRDYAKPVGVATYKTSKGMSEELLRALPSIEELESLLEGTK